MTRNYLERYNTQWETVGPLRKLAPIALVGLASVSAGILIVLSPLALPLILGALFAVVALSVALRNMRKVLVFWILVVPIIPSYVGVSILSDRYVVTLSRLMLAVLSVAFLLSIVSRKVKVGAVPLRVLFLVCVLVYLFSAIFSLLPIESLTRLSSERWLGAFVIFYLAYFLVQSESDAGRIFSVALLGAGLVSIIAIVTTATGTDFKELFSFWTPYSRYMGNGPLTVEDIVTGRSFRAQISILRNSASLAHELELGNYLSFLLPIAWGRMLYASKKWHYRVLVVLMLSGIIFSYERGPLMFTVVEIALVTLISRRGVRLALGTIVGSAVLVLLVYVRPDVNWGYGSTNPYSLSAFMAYIHPYLSFLDLFNYRPLLGLGPGVSSIIYWDMDLQSAITDIGGTVIRPWDAPILMRLQETGILGTLGWLGFLTRCGYLIWRQGILDLRNSARVGMDQIAVAIALTMALLDSTFQAGVFAWAQSTVIVMVLLGTTLRLSLFRSRKDRSC